MRLQGCYMFCVCVSSRFRQATMFTTCPFVHPSCSRVVRPFVCNQTRKHDFLKTNEPILMPVGNVRHGTRAWNSQLWGSSTSSDIASRQRLRSASRRQLDVPRHYRSKFDRRTFSVAGTVVWNSLPVHLHDSSLSFDSFKTALKSLHAIHGVPVTLAH